MTPAGLITVPAVPAGGPVAGSALASPQSAGADSPVGGGEGGASGASGEGGMGGFTRASTAQGFGVGWLLEPHARQAALEALEAEVEHFRTQMVRERLHRVRHRRLSTIWRAWGGLVEATRRRQAQRLAKHKLAAHVAAAADAGAADAASDHTEWWRREAEGRKKKPPRSPLKLQAMV